MGAGMGYPVVLVHGMWCTSASWKRVVDILSPRGYDCYVPSLPAHDDSTDQPLQVRRQSLRDYLDAIERGVAERDFAHPPIVIGHSMGGLLAQQLATRIKPLAMVLLTPATPRGINALTPTVFAAFLPWLLGGAFWRNPHKLGFAHAQRYAFNGVPVDRHRALYESLVHESGRAAFELGLWPLDFSRASLVHSAKVECPVYIVSCGKDRLTPAGVVRKLMKRYRHATLRHYAERGHWVIDDDETEEMMHAICGWLRPYEQRHLRSVS
ncbi:alpha/beta hydrolase [Solimonas marina]|uniref:Alpha/beta hydrolase n=1 Tax=Solimonas marina TaxID=2714601 RepID=A0A970B5V0_9GAMM|nr:alpha/beta fold hydrolase [Solimonas marina]NKF23782.1 alpha/beta hydrolase [Solimonas marina]